MSERIVDVYPEETAERFQEVVRCRDCKHADEIMTRYAGMQHACMRFDDATVTPDGFCAWGERREG